MKIYTNIISFKLLLIEYTDFKTKAHLLRDYLYFDLYLALPLYFHKGPGFPQDFPTFWGQKNSKTASKNSEKCQKW